MWRWFQGGIRRRPGPTAAEVLAEAQALHANQREAVEGRMQLAVAEATGRAAEAAETRLREGLAEAASHAEDLLRRHAEAAEARLREGLAEAASHAEDLLRRHAEPAEERFRGLIAEATEPRIQLAINEAIACGEERFSSIVREVKEQRQHIPAFLNAMATVPALAFELSSLRTAQKMATASASEPDATSRELVEVKRETRNEAASYVRALEHRLTTADHRNNQLAEFLRRFEGALIDRENDYVALRTASERITAELSALSSEFASEQRRLSEVTERTAAHLSTALTEIAALQGETERTRAELQQLREALTDGHLDRGNLWKCAETATRGIGDLWHRLEFVRKEILYEMRFSSGAASLQPNKTRRPSRIVDEGKLEAARKAGNVRLNLGCGHVPLPGYLNVDFRDLPGVDIVCDLADLPFEPGTVDEITSSHVLEHFAQAQLNRLLPYWRTLLKSKGTFRAVVPDGEAMLTQLAAGTYKFEDFRTVLFGAQEYDGDFHFNMFTPETLGQSLTEAGFLEISFPATGRKNDICFEFEVAGIAP